MLDTTAGNQTLAWAQIVTPDGVFDGAVDLEDGRIAGLRPGVRPAGATDLEGDFLIPGIVDVHTDHVEAHVFPRAGVQWDFLNALMAHDAVVIAGGTTTVLDSLCVGASMKRPERRDLLVPLVAALERGRAEGLFRADHLLHLRCEICDPDTAALTDATISSPLCDWCQSWTTPPETGKVLIVTSGLPAWPRTWGWTWATPVTRWPNCWRDPPALAPRCARMWWPRRKQRDCR